MAHVRVHTSRSAHALSSAADARSRRSQRSHSPERARAPRIRSHMSTNPKLIPRACLRAHAALPAQALFVAGALCCSLRRIKNAAQIVCATPCL